MSRRALHATVVSTLVLCVLIAMVGPALAGDQQDAPSIELDDDGGELVLDPEPNQTISGETDLDPGTDLFVFVQSDDEDYPLVEQTYATVEDDGTFKATIFQKGSPDLKEGEAIEGQIEVSYSDGDTTASVSTRMVVLAGPWPPGEVTFHGGEEIGVEPEPGQVISGETDIDLGTELLVEVRIPADPNATEWEGIERETATVSLEHTFAVQVDRFEELEPGDEASVSVYLANGPDEPLATTTAVIVEGVETLTPTETETQADGTESEAPGFGILVGLAALAGTLLLARRD